MKNVLLFLTVITVFVNFAFAGGDALATSGDKALMFQFYGLANLGAGAYVTSPGGEVDVTDYGTFDIPSYGGIGFKFYLSDGMAARTALLFGFSSLNDKDLDTKESSMALGLELGIQANIIKSGSFVGYVGGIGNFLYINSSKNAFFTVLQSEPIKADLSLNLITFGVAAVAGFEYFIYDRISLGAEYQLGMAFASGTADANLGPWKKTDLPSAMTVGIGTASFKLAAFF